MVIRRPFGVEKAGTSQRKPIVARAPILQQRSAHEPAVDIEELDTLAVTDRGERRLWLGFENGNADRLCIGDEARLDVAVLPFAKTRLVDQIHPTNDVGHIPQPLLPCRVRCDLARDERLRSLVERQEGQECRLRTWDEREAFHQAPRYDGVIRSAGRKQDWACCRCASKDDRCKGR